MKKAIIYLIGIIVELIWLAYVKINLDAMNIIQYMIYSIVIPALIVAVTSFIYALRSQDSARKNYAYSVVNSIIMATILIVFCLLFINEDVINLIMNNTVTSDHIQVSISQAKAGDNIQSYLIFIAIGGLGTLLGNRIGKKKDEPKQDEYDD